MCGKFTQMYSWREVQAFSEPLMRVAVTDELVVATPMRPAMIMRLDGDGAREMVPMRWGFADRNAASPARPKHMHARSESIDTRPTFADAFAQRRGILMVHTFNEGEELPSGKVKQWTITPRDGEPIAIAVICEEWRNGAEVLDTFVMVTTPPNALIAQVTDRMPAVLPRETWSLWLGETGRSLADVKQVLQTFEDGGAWSMAPQESKKAGKRPPSGDQPDFL